MKRLLPIQADTGLPGSARTETYMHLPRATQPGQPPAPRLAPPRELGDNLPKGLWGFQPERPSFTPFFQSVSPSPFHPVSFACPFHLTSFT